MPHLKTESEVATMRYLRERTAIPVPVIYHYDSNPFNRLGGEYIIMSKVIFFVPSVFLSLQTDVITRDKCGEISACLNCDFPRPLPTLFAKP